MAPVSPSALADAHLQAQAQLRGVVVRAVTQIWTGLPGYDRDNVDQYLAGVIPFVTTAQRRSVALTDAYVARALDRRPLGIDPTYLTGAVLRGGSPPEEVYTRAFVTVWSALGRSVPYEDAVAAGLHRSTSTAEMDVQLSHRAAYAAIQDADRTIRGYQRAADGAACTFCLTVDGAFVKSADALALHNRCGCGLEPITEHVVATPTPEDVAVHTHGELGAVLTAPGDHFTSLSDFT